MNRNGGVSAIFCAVAMAWVGAANPLAAQGNAIVQVTLPNTLAANDDGSTDAVPLGIGGANGINFFGQIFTQVYVNNNGNITFGGPFGEFTPNAFSQGVPQGCDNVSENCLPIIAPFFADVDTSGMGSGLVMYGNATVQGSDGQNHNAFVANYVNVGYCCGETDKLNSFQVILLDRSDTGPGNFDIEFNYNTILWETGDASGGTDGLGGTSAAVGYSNGQTGTNNIYFQLPGSLVNGALINGGADALISHSVNSTVPGRYIFPVRQGQVTLLISGVSCVPAVLGQGTVSTCTITLTGNAPAGGVTNVTLASSSPALTVPASITVPVGQNTATFTATAGSASSNQQVTITATLQGLSETTTVSVTNATQVGYIGVFYDSTPPSPCPATLSVLCTANNTANNNPNGGDGGPIDAPVFVFVNTGSADITNAVLTIVGVDFFNVGTIPANNGNNPVIVIPGVSNDGQNHGANNFFTYTGEPYDSSDNFPSLNSTQFQFSGQQGGTQIQSVDVCGTINPPIFTPACTVQPLSNDGGSSNINFLGGPGDNDGGCNNCFGPQIVALLNTVTSGGGPPAVTISTTSLSNGTVSTAGTQTFTATGGTGPYTWSLAGGTLPPGVTLAANGTLSGTPTKPGTYTFSVEVTDANGNTALETVNFTISAQPVTITTPSPLPSGMVSVQYPTQVLSATGGFAPYTFKLSDNQLPAGLTLSSNGTISGTPAATGTSRFTIVATDVTGQTGSATLSITIRPLSPDLTTSSGSLSFTLAAGSVALPPAQTVYVEATETTTVVGWSATNTPVVSWLTVTGGKSGSITPGSFSVSLTSAAEQLAASSTPYTATIVVACAATSPCAGNSQNITVSLTVSTVSPELSALTDLLSFNTAAANPEETTQTVGVQNAGGGTLSFTSVTCGATWCVPGAAPGALGGGATANISVQGNPAGLSAGFYFTELTIVSSAGTAQVPVTLLIQSNPSLVLSPSGNQMTVPAGGVVANPDTTFLVNITGAASANTSVAWTASLLPGASWLNLSTTSGSSTNALPGTVSYSVSRSAVSALSAGIYYATIRVTSSGVVNSPQDFQVVLDVEAANAPQVPNPTPAGLVFVTLNGAAPPAQNDLVYASSATAVPYQASATTSDGANWLSVSPATGTTSAQEPAPTSISVNPTGLAAGIYHGTVSYSLAAAAVPAVNVTFIVKGPEPLARPGQPIQQITVPSCTPTKIVPTQTALVNDFAAPAAWPTPLQVQLNDDCGNAVVNGQVVSTFSNGDPPLILVPQDATSGLYSATWTPHGSSSQVTVLASASATGLASATELISGEVVPNQVPAINPGGTVHAFTPQTGQPLAPGTWMAIYGSDLADETLINNAAVFPPTLAGTQVIIGGEQAPLYFVSTGQINALIPYDLPVGQTYEVIVSNNGALSAPASFTASAITPGVAAYASGYAEAEDAITGNLITATSPATPGEYIAIYLLGMGPTSTLVASGQPSPPNELTTTQPTLTLNGENITPILYSGLTPTAVGLYQIDFQIPADAPNGALPLIVTEGGVQAPSVILPVHN